MNITKHDIVMMLSLAMTTYFMYDYFIAGGRERLNGRR